VAQNRHGTWHKLKMKMILCKILLSAKNHDKRRAEKHSDIALQGGKITTVLEATPATVTEI